MNSLFAAVMDGLTSEVRSESLWAMMFVGYIVICSENSEPVEETLQRWRYPLGSRGMKVSRNKTEWTRCRQVSQLSCKE